MKAALCEAYGPPEVVRVREVPTPTPKDDEILVRIRATTVSSGDARIRRRDFPRGFGVIAGPVFGFSRPRQPILGTEFAGEVAAVGRSVTRFSVGDAVVGFPGAGMACHAEFRTMPETGRVIAKAAKLGFEDAAALCFGGTTALDFLRRGGLRAGERILVVGASGAVGSAVVQIARHIGAEVTGVCGTSNLDLVRGLGAERVIDYTGEDFSRQAARYDLVLDTTGAVSAARHGHLLAPGGRLLLVAADLPGMLGAAWRGLTGGTRVVAGPAAERVEDLRHLAGLAESGAFRPVIDTVYPLERIAEAHARVDTARKRGSVVIAMG